MKNLFYFICFFAFLTPSFAGDLPQIISAVTDEPDLLTPAEEAMLTADIENLKKQTGVRMALLLVKATDGIPIEDYASKVAQNWKGGTKGRDDGILYVLTVGDRKMRLELDNDLKPVIPDVQALQILDQVKDDLKNEKYFVAFSKMISQVEKKTSFIKPGAPIGKPPPLLGKWVVVYWIIFFLGAYPLVCLTRFLFKNKSKEKSKLPAFIWLVAFFILSPLILILRGKSGLDPSSAMNILFYALAHVFLTLLIAVPLLFFRRIYLGLTGQGWGVFGGEGSSNSSGRDGSFGGGGGSSSW